MESLTYQLQVAGEFGRHTLLPALAVGALALGLSDVIPADALGANGSGHPPETTLYSPPLRSISKLPGFSLDVTKKERSELASSTLKLTERYYSSQQPNPNPWYDTCTLLDVSIPGVSTTYGLTANHCFGNITGAHTGSFINPSDRKQTALNYIYASTTQFDIVDPLVPPSQRNNFPIGEVTGISADTQGVDQALLQIGLPNKADQTAPYNGERPFQDVPAVPITKMVMAGVKPVIGQEVAMYGIPGASGNTPVIATGRYIGRYILLGALNGNEQGGALTRALDIVVVPADSPQKDACEHGSSGGSAVTSTGQFFNDLSYRLSTGYGSQHRYDPSSDTATYDQTMIPSIEKALKVKIPLGDTVCGFSVPRKNFIYTLLAGLSNNYIPLKEKGGGGGK
jgi:hypothetical protein